MKCIKTWRSQGTVPPGVEQMFREAQGVEQLMDQSLAKEKSQSAASQHSGKLPVLWLHLGRPLVAVGGPGQPVFADHRCPGHRSPPVTSLAVDGVG